MALHSRRSQAVASTMLRFAALLLCAVALLASTHARSADLTRAEEIAVRNAVDNALEQVRDIILNGDPDSGIPVLDPLVVNEWDFNVDEEPAVSAEGGVSDARVDGLGAFVVEKSKISISLLPPKATVTVAVRVPSVNARGDYRLNGDAHLDSARQDIHVEADGDFTVVIKDISFQVKAVVSLSYKVKSVDVTLGLGDIYIEVQGAGDVGDVINEEAAARIEQWFADNRSDLEKELAEIIKAIIES